MFYATVNHGRTKTRCTLTSAEVVESKARSKIWKKSEN